MLLLDFDVDSTEYTNLVESLTGLTFFLIPARGFSGRPRREPDKRKEANLTISWNSKKVRREPHSDLCLGAQANALHYLCMN